MCPPETWSLNEGIMEWSKKDGEENARNTTTEPKDKRDRHRRTGGKANGNGLAI